MLPTQQKALVLPEKGADFVLETAIPVPKPGKDDILVKIKSVSLTPADAKMRKFGLLYGDYPGIVGLDISGEVVELGEPEGAGRFKVGDRVFYGGNFKNEYSGFQEYSLADKNTMTLIPSTLSYDEASTLPVAVGTAYLGLYNILPYGLGLQSVLEDSSGVGAYQGKAIFISGGSGSVGQTGESLSARFQKYTDPLFDGVIQFAKLSGFSYIITTASAKHTEYLKSLGATHIIDRDIPVAEIPAKLESIVGSLDIEAAYDSIGDAETSLAQTMAAVPPGGRVVTTNPRVEFEPQDGKSLSRVIATATIPYNVELLRKLALRLPGLLEDKSIKPARIEVLPGGLTAIPGGLDRLLNGQASGFKLVIRVEDTP
ncbi:hypothetical protein MD484_g3072, partial [Candolleomyces efflorescens]